MSIEWINKRQKHTSVCDVSVTAHNLGKKGCRTCFTFRNDSWQIVTTNEYVNIGIDKEKPNRLYFAQGEHGIGYKLWTQGSVKSRYLTASPELVKTFAGDYNLFFDTQNKLYYIDTNKKKGCERV